MSVQRYFSLCNRHTSSYIHDATHKRHWCKIYRKTNKALLIAFLWQNATNSNCCLSKADQSCTDSWFSVVRVCVCVCVLGFVFSDCSWPTLPIRAQEVLAHWSVFLCQNNTQTHLLSTANDNNVLLENFHLFFSNYQVIRFIRSSTFNFGHYLLTFLGKESVKEAFCVVSLLWVCDSMFNPNPSRFDWHILLTNPEAKSWVGGLRRANRGVLFSG